MGGGERGEGVSALSVGAENARGGHQVRMRELELKARASPVSVDI